MRRETLTKRKIALFGLGLTACALGLAGAVTWSRFTTALEVERARVRRGSRVFTSPRFGQIEFATAGQGAPVLVVHGAGGGFDQPPTGRLVAAGYQVIVPSRFGYLRSSSPSDPTPENQADAFAALLDELQIRSTFVVGISAGALSALQFAVRHPDRCRALILIVPAASAAGQRSRAQGPMPQQGSVSRAIVERLVKSDFLYWLGVTLAHDWMMRSVLATDPAVVAAASPAERERADTILRHVLPISARSEGLLNDVRFVSVPQPIAFERITAPTLVFSLEDDYYRTLEPARVIAATIPGAGLVTYPTGGHVWVGHHAELFAEADAFLRLHERP
jgi:2-hydroxy-6-oxonona-2,4-dienedioate hydrolase